MGRILWNPVLLRNAAKLALLLLAATLLGPAGSQAQHIISFTNTALSKPPPGFTALFNGKDFTGWHGMARDFDPRKLWAMTQEERAQKITEWNEEFKKHWRVENGELVNDGKGPYATTDEEYGDIELLIEYKTVPKADS